MNIDNNNENTRNNNNNQSDNNDNNYINKNNRIAAAIHTVCTYLFSWFQTYNGENEEPHYGLLLESIFEFSAENGKQSFCSFFFCFVLFFSGHLGFVCLFVENNF